jgi:hypothetical protein
MFSLFHAHNICINFSLELKKDILSCLKLGITRVKNLFKFLCGES